MKILIQTRKNLNSDLLYVFTVKIIQVFEYVIFSMAFGWFVIRQDPDPATLLSGNYVEISPEIFMTQTDVIDN